MGENYSKLLSGTFVEIDKSLLLRYCSDNPPEIETIIAIYHSCVPVHPEGRLSRTRSLAHINLPL